MIRYFKMLAVAICLGALACSIFASASAQQADAPKGAGEFPSQWFFHTSKGRPSGGDREWTMAGGLKLTGLPFVDELGNVELRRQAGEPPNTVYLSLADFIEEDRQAILSALPKVQDQYRKFSLYQGAEVEPKWANAQPKFPQRFRKVIYADEKHVYFSSGDSLILVDKSAFTIESLTETMQSIAKVRHQVILNDYRRSLNVVGVPLRLSVDGLVMEVMEPHTSGDLKFTRDLRYLVPRHLLQAPFEELVAQVAAEVQAEGSIAQPTESEMKQLPRVCRTARGMVFVLPRFADGRPEILAGAQIDQATPIGPHELSCHDYVWWASSDAGRNDTTGTSSDGANIPADVLTTLVDGIDKRDLWTQSSGRTFRGQLQGLAANGFIFQTPGVGKFFVPAAQLDEVDAAVAMAASTQAIASSTWFAPEQDELRSVFSRRIMFNANVVELRGEPSGVNSAVECDVPGAYYAGSKDNRYTLDRLEDILAARDVHNWLEENAELLTSTEPSVALKSLAAKYPLKPNHAATKLLPNRESRRWRLASSNGQFEAVLVGTHNGDFVFEETVDGNVKTFLVDRRALEAKSQAEADSLSQRLEAKDWSNILTRHPNWQNYRIGYDSTGKVRFPGQPVVVLSVSDSLIIFESLDGRRTSEPLPRDPTAQQATTTAFKAALNKGLQQRQAAESHLSLWSFQDAEPTLRAELIGANDNCVLVRDVNRAEFLISRPTLSTATKSMLDAALKSTPALRRIEATDEWELPRVWCMRKEIVGPAVAEYQTDDHKQLVILPANGVRQVLQLDDLTMRDHLSFLAAWGLRNNTLELRNDLPQADSQRTLDVWLSAPVPKAEQLTSAAKLDPEIERRIRAAFDDWQHEVWPASPINLPQHSKLLAVNADASAGIVEMESSWHVVDFASGQSNLVRDGKQTESIQFGPWMGTDSKTVYWVEAGEMKIARPNQKIAALAKDGIPTVVAACQSGDFQSLVVFLSDHSLRRISLDNQHIELLVSPDKLGELPSDRVSIWASNDGQSVFLSRGTSNQLFVSPRDNQPELSSFLGSQQPPSAVAVGTSYACLGKETTPRALTHLVAATMFLRPSTFSIPCPAQWMGEVDLDGRTVFQSIGRFEDARSLATDRYFVTYRGPKGFFEEFATQFIEGQVDERAKMAANGAALVHWRGEQAVVSRRPDKLSRSPELLIGELVEELVAQRDIGQLEAIDQLMHAAPYSERGPHFGWWPLKFQKIVTSVCLHYQEHLGGDCLARAMSLAEHFRKRFPKSQVAANILADLELQLAWEARGGGFADTVTPAGIDAFKVHMRQARTLLEPLLAKGNPSAATFDSAIDVAMGTGDMQLAKRLADQLAKSSHVRNSTLQHSLCFLLLPRWHGKPGSTEAYRDSVVDKLGIREGDILYSQLVLSMFDVHGWGQQLSQVMKVDPERVVLGVEAYYESSTDPELMDRALVFTGIERDFELCKRLLTLKADKQLLPSNTVARSPGNFRTIERELGK